MSSFIDEPVGSQATSALALLPNKSKQKQLTETPKLTPHMQRRSDALSLAELIYDIYNRSCPVSSLDEKQRGMNNV